MFEAFILAGGSSARMEREKALIQLNGENFVDRTARILNEAGAERISVLAGSNEKILKKHFPDLNVVNDFSPGLGASGGIFTALTYSRSENVFVIACDLPFVTPELIDLLKTRFKESTVDAVVPMQADKFKQPLCAFYRKSTCLVPFQAQLLRSEMTPSARDLLDTVKTEYVDYETLALLSGSANFFLNINTPLDLESAREIARVK